MNRKNIVRFLALVNGISGLVILGWVFFPIISYQVNSKLKFTELLSPIPGGQASQVGFPNLNRFDYTKASNWFVDGKASGEFVTSKVDSYTLSIPKLGIERATTAIGGEDLSEHLIHYPGTSVPGKKGNSVVFGHSILPQFYDPKDYLAVFSTLPSLAQGDEIKVDFDGVSYSYRVEDMFEVAPTDIQILEQDPSDSFLTLVTCVPPGHPLRPKRLIVRARVVPPEGSGVSSTINETFRN